MKKVSILTLLLVICMVVSCKNNQNKAQVEYIPEAWESIFENYIIGLSEDDIVHSDLLSDISIITIGEKNVKP